MTEPVFFGVPVSLAFLYFVVYSILGWCMETVYCSIRERRFVPRGFLYGPMCPIYGVGALMMICWFRPLMGNPLLFYLTATLCMSAWEYLVGWFLETTTHIKYWDYSMYRFHLKGRICLWVCLMWGGLAFLHLYFIHPRVERVIGQIGLISRYIVDGFFLGALSSDTVATVYQLAKTSQLLGKLQQVGDQLRLQVHLGKAELSDMLEEAKEVFTGRLEDLLPDQLDDTGRTLKERYDELMARTEMVTRRFRASYRRMTAAGPVKEALESVKRRGERLRARLQKVKRKKD